MKRLVSLFTLMVVICVFAVKAQVVTTEPAILQEDSQNVTIIFKASEGDGGMKGSTTCYAHTGVITNKSNGEWAYGPATWGDNNAKYKLVIAGTNKWKLKIGNIREFYGITDPSEKVLKLCFVFRSKDGSKTGREADGGDIFVDVHQSGLALSFTSNAKSSVLNASTNNVTFTAATTQVADMKIYLNSVSSTPVAKIAGNTKLEYSHTFATGDYDVIAEAVAGGKTLRDTISLCHRRESQVKNYSGILNQGTTRNADGSVTFCLLAPNKKNVMLVGEWNKYKPTNAQVMDVQNCKYFWTTVSGIDAHTDYAYYYIVDDNINVADPYAKMVLDPWNDKWLSNSIYPNLKPFPKGLKQHPVAVLRGNGDGYNWEVKDFNGADKGNLVIYELLFRDFTKEQTVKAATAKLDYLKGLGVNAIELMPIQEFDGNNSWGYNPNFYFATDKAYGTDYDYKQFIDECHKRGIAVILDVVFNHAYGQHPWCQMYWKDNKPSSDNPFFNENAPHNWSVGNDWKQENPDVQNYLCDVLKYWINEYKVDGYRFDLVKGLGDSNSYASDYDANSYNVSRVKNMKRFTDAIRSVKSNAYVIFESFVSGSEENEYGAYGCMTWNKQCEVACQMIGGYKSSSSFAGLNDTKNYKISFMESHDEERTTFWANEYASAGIKGNLATTMRRSGSAAALAFLAKGAKMLWQFEEMGYDVSINDPGRTDPKPVRWEYLDNADRKGLVDSYSEIINIRTSNPDLFSAEAESYMTAGSSDWDNGRFLTAKNKKTGKELVVVVNPTFNDKTFSYKFDNPSGKYYINSKSYNTNPSVNAAASQVTVPAHGYVVISNMENALGGVEDIVASETANVCVYPNPATDVVFVNADNVESVKVYSLTGALVAESEGENSVNVDHLANGSYVVRIATAEGVATTKLIKK